MCPIDDDGSNPIDADIEITLRLYKGTDLNYICQLVGLDLYFQR
jgi:hypothetical protein